MDKSPALMDFSQSFEVFVGEILKFCSQKTQNAVSGEYW